MPLGSVRLVWGGKGLRACCEMELADGGRLQGQIVSQQPARLAFPEEGTLNAAVQDIGLSMIRPWIPPSFS